MPSFMSGDRIVGGEMAPFPIPWQVSVRYCQSGSCHFCGGTILDSTTVLCAAHCTPKAGQYIMTGSKMRSDTNAQVSFNTCFTTYMVSH